MTYQMVYYIRIGSTWLRRGLGWLARAIVIYVALILLRGSLITLQIIIFSTNEGRTSPCVVTKLMTV